MAIIVAAVVAPASPTALASSSIGPSADPTTVSLSIEVGRPHEPPLLVHRGERRAAESPCVVLSHRRRSRLEPHWSVRSAGIAACPAFPRLKRRCLCSSLAQVRCTDRLCRRKDRSAYGSRFSRRPHPGIPDSEREE